MRVLTCLGDATSLHTHGGLPYHLLDAGKRVGFLNSGWQLAPENFRYARLRWNLRRLFTRGEYGGFQYTECFLRALVLEVPSGWANPDEIVSIFPLLPPSHSQRTKISVYIDATLKENFEDYGIDRKVGRSIIDDALERERQAYRNAVHIVCRSRTAAKSVVEDYGIDARKVHVVPGGANIVGDPGISLYGPVRLPMKPVRLGFIGKDWRRKNLAFVLAVADVLNARGLEVEILVAGFDPESGPRHPLLNAVGFLDKRSQTQTFIDVLRCCHFTCLFSHAEAFGLSNRESLRLGVPVLASDVGGIPDTVPEGCGHFFSRDAEAGDVADMVEGYVRDPARYWALRDAVARRSEEFTWAAAVEKMQAIWSGSNAYALRAGASDA